MNPGRSSALITDDGPLFRLEPFERESFFGFTARLAAWNHFDGRRRFLLGIGFEHLRREGLEVAVEKPEKTARLLRLTEDQLGRLVGLADPLGAEYRRTLDMTGRCVSPTSLRRSPFHRSVWSQRLPYCPESWDILLSTCPECRRYLGWVKVLAVELCEHCGFDLRRAQTRTVPVGQRKSLKLLAGLIDHDPEKRRAVMEALPVHFDGCSPFDVFALAMTFARAKELMKLEPEIDDGPLYVERHLRKAARCAAGMEILATYPDSFDSLVFGPNAARPSLLIFARRYSSQRVRPLLEKLDSDWEPCRHGPSRLRIAREQEGKLTLREAARELRIENGALRGLIGRGLLGAPEGRGVVRKCQWLEPQEVRDAAMRLEDRMSLQEFSHRFKIPIRGAEQLLLLGLLERHKDPMVVALHGGVQLYRGAVGRFAHALLAARRVPLPDISVLPLEDLFHGVGAQEKPWGAILRAALEGQIPLYADSELSERLQIRRLQISRSLADEILAGERPQLRFVPNPYIGRDHGRMTRVEVESYLNCFPRDVSWLLEEGQLVSELHADQVAELGQKVISSREISWRWRVSPALRDGLVDRGITRCLGPFWLRAQVEDYFGQMFPSGRPT